MCRVLTGAPSTATVSGRDSAIHDDRRRARSNAGTQPLASGGPMLTGATRGTCAMEGLYQTNGRRPYHDETRHPWLHLPFDGRSSPVTLLPPPSRQRITAPKGIILPLPPRERRTAAIRSICPPARNSKAKSLYVWRRGRERALSHTSLLILNDPFKWLFIPEISESRG